MVTILGKRRRWKDVLGRIVTQWTCADCSVRYFDEPRRVSGWARDHMRRHHGSDC